MQHKRVRHFTTDSALKEIRATGKIRAGRGWGRIDSGIHVEVEPFGTTRPSRPGRSGSKNDMNCVAEEAYVEFDAPPGMVPYFCGPRNTAVVPVEHSLSLEGLNPVFVKVRRYFWEFWRTKATE